jgi:hypothetical protein
MTWLNPMLINGIMMKKKLPSLLLSGRLYLGKLQQQQKG